MLETLGPWGEAALTSLGFFWKAGWAFVLGYTISAMIQAFVPRERLARHMGAPSVSSVALATGFGAISSSCSFAALSAARALVLKGAHFVAALAFMFASTNLVIELGVLIWIFLGWPFVVAELVGGVLLIAISTLLARATCPREWLDAARERVEREAEAEEEDFDWRERIRSRAGWRLVGRRFAGEWGMVWQEVLVGFTVAGIVATFVPDRAWRSIFLADAGGSFGVVLENALVAPLVAAATFIGSMGNIPLATVLAGGGVLFGGVMAFIYSDLMVPPLVKINAKYYGWRVALWIAAIMYVSIVLTALALHYGIAAVGMTPETRRAVSEVTRFALDYTFWLNLAAVALAAAMLRLRAGDDVAEAAGHAHEHGGAGFGLQDAVTALAACFLAGGAGIALLRGLG